MEHGQDLRQYGLTSHEGSRGSTLYDRIKKYIELDGICATSEMLKK